MSYFPPLGKVERDLVFSSSTHWVTEVDCNCSLTLCLPYDDAVGSWDLVVVNLFLNLFASYFLETKIMFISIYFLDSPYRSNPPGRIAGIAPYLPCKYPLLISSDFLGENSAREYKSDMAVLLSFSTNSGFDSQVDVTININSNSAILMGIKCRWFTKNGEL